MEDTCADCRTRRPSDEMFMVVPPVPDERDLFWLCKFCWDRIIGLAMMQAIR